MRVMVTGGAGYIGAHTCRMLAERGDYAVVIDDLVTGFRDRISEFPLVSMNIATGSAERLEAILREHRIDAVMHFAGQKQLSESV